jgi:hypothetical protein
MIGKIKDKLNAFLEKYALEYRILVVVAIVYLFYVHYSGCN